MKFLLLLLLFNCSSKNKQLENQTPHGHEELYSEPNKIEKLSSKRKRIVIAATSDIEGHYQPHFLKVTDDHNREEQTVAIGGMDVMSSYFKVLRKQYENVLLVDSGNIFQGDSRSLSQVQDFYSTLKYDAITVGLGDFNVKLPEGVSSNTGLFKKFSENSKTPLVLSNLYELRTGRVVEWKGILPYFMKEIDGVKVGVIGLIPDDIISQTPVDNRVGLFVENMVQSTLRQARLLRSLGADLIVVLNHQGLECGKNLAEDMKLPLSKVNFEPKKTSICNLDSPLGEYLERLPPELVDVIIGGRTGLKMANFINGTLVMGGFGQGENFNYVEFLFDSKTKKIVREETKVHQPVVFCREFFKETSDCYAEDTSINHKERIPAKFLGVDIVPDAGVSRKMLEPTVMKKTSELNITSALKSQNADLALVSSSKLETQLVLLKLSGRELSSILEEDYNFSRHGSWYPSPFKLEKNLLHLTVSGGAVELQKEYAVLCDLVALQKHPRLKRSLTDSSSQALMSVSWESASADKDVVNTTASSIKH